MILGFLVGLELQTSFIQSRVLAATARKITYQVEPGPSTSIYYPDDGPYNESLGYTKLPQFLQRLDSRGFQIQSQARNSPWMLKIADLGLYPIYKEKTQTGLEILGPVGQDLYHAKYPGRVYPKFEAIPPLVVDALLFIENREAMDTAHPYRNPSVEWDRLAKAMLDLGIHQVYSGHPVSGGSTLATQMEKIRHSPEGRTASTVDKFRQMASASLRAYQDGEETLETRRRIIRDYINSIPLAAIPGYGEVRGLGDGLWAWYGADFDHINTLVATIGAPGTEAMLPDQAIAFRQALSLLLALRKPTTYLIDDPAALAARTNGYIRLLAEDRKIPLALRDAALDVHLVPRSRAPERESIPFSERKAADAIRVALMQFLGINSFYELDRLDLSVRATLDSEANKRVSDVLQRFADPGFASSSGLVGYHLLGGGDPSQVVYSFNLYEHVGGANVLRVQADNYNQPLDINEGTRLELGSTAKLRTLVHYLEIITDLHKAYAHRPDSELAKLEIAPDDHLTRWAVDYLRWEKNKDLTPMLQAAMLRTYSASPAERFFTGGGVHQFANFDADDNNRVLTVREAFERSVNLVFIRLMRDIVHYHMYRLPEVTPTILTSEEDPSRLDYLARFADREGSQFLTSFWRKYKDMAPDDALELSLKQIRPTQTRLAVIFRSTRPEAPIEDLRKFMDAHLAGGAPAESALSYMYRTYGPDQMSLNDRGYVARIHPLELFTLEYLHRRPKAPRRDLLKASIEARQEVYEWLYKVPSKAARDNRILTLLEVDAFDEILDAWQRLGFPFQTMTPSYATAIGSSGDNPAALAELMGIIVNSGMRYPTVRIDALHFGEGTPVDTTLRRRATGGERVLPAAVAAVVREELQGVVEHGTAVRASGAIVLDGKKLPIGGKTGTGDNRFDVYSKNHQLIESKVVNRTATFVFYVGDRFFGTITAFVPGAEAANYKFTSALPVQIFKTLAPAFSPLIERKPANDPGPRIVSAKAAA